MSQRGIQSIEVGGRLLLALGAAGRPMALKDLAQAADMTPPKAHPYLVSFGKLGLIAKDAVSGHYGLGPLAMQLGLISLQQFDPVRLATARLPALAQALGQTVAIAVWGHRGATIVRTEEAPSLVYVGMRHGAVMSLRGTASGRLFAAHLPRDVVAAAGDGPGDAVSGGAFDGAFEAELAAIRRDGLARVEGTAVAGVSALAAPVFDGGGSLVLSLTAIGPSASFDVTADGPAATTLRRCAAELSAQLGAQPAVS
ncbi:IclR family transcriptional regulator [Rubrivivax sp. RP6-9]|uniref:IclR family transcriptional regulator n=1 Tax=Rubrivivax sp. RP6-9 TaxID=3415750 RepID=UPI003CC6C42A